MTDTVFVGIDPGVTGAIAVIYPDGVVEIRDLPTMEIRGKKSKKRVLDSSATFVMLADLPPNLRVALEAFIIGPAMKPKSGGGKGLGQSVTSLCGSADLNGQLRMALTALQHPFEVVQPQVWKPAMMPGEARDKDAARQKAIQMFPQAAEMLKLKKHHNRAEALLLAEWLRRRG